MFPVAEVVQGALQISTAFLWVFMYSEIAVCMILSECDLNSDLTIAPLTLSSDKWT